MERPDDETLAWYERTVPADARVVKGKMFAHPCAFVNGNLFFGTFAQGLIARVGEARAAALVKERRLRLFEPMQGRAWAEYVHLYRDDLGEREVMAIAKEALAYTDRLPPKASKKKAPAKAPAPQKPKSRKP